jgi:hypothetical protein
MRRGERRQQDGRWRVDGVSRGLHEVNLPVMGTITYLMGVWRFHPLMASFGPSRMLML